MWADGLPNSRCLQSFIFMSASTIRGLGSLRIDLIVCEKITEMQTYVPVIKLCAWFWKI